MFELKRISKDAIPAALAKAQRYRLLNEPHEAESICRDALRTEPKNQEGVATLLLALTDQFATVSGGCLDEARELLPRLHDDYERTYYEGVIFERWGKAQRARGTPGYVVNDWFRKAMSCYATAEEMRPPANDDAILRWNTCARMIERESSKDRHEHPPAAKWAEPFDDEVPVV